MPILTASAFSKKYKVSKPTLTELCNSGTIVCKKIYHEKSGKVRRVDIDTDHKKNIKYINNIDRGKQLVNRIMSKKKSKTESLESVGSEVVDGEVMGGLSGIESRFLIAKTRKEEAAASEKELKNAARRGEMLVAQSVYDSVFMYLDELNTNLERLGDSFLSDIAMEIVDNKKLTPEIRAKWRDSIKSQIVDARDHTEKELRRIAEEQGKK